MTKYDKGEHVKETFAYFGRAYYMSNVFEEGLNIAILQMDFLRAQIPVIKKQGLANFDREKYQSAFDKFVAENQAKTLGNLIKRVYELAEFEADFKLLKPSVYVILSPMDFLESTLKSLQLARGETK